MKRLQHRFPTQALAIAVLWLSIVVSVVPSALCAGTESVSQNPPDSDIAFQGMTWTAQDKASLSIEKHRGLTSLRIRSRSMNSLARIQDVEFSEGRVEFEIASMGRIPPWICFGIPMGNSPDDTEYDQLMLNPWPNRDTPVGARLYQAVLTRNRRNSLVINYRQSSETFDSTAWTHVAIVVKKGMCQIFLDGDDAPAIVLNNPFASGTIGIRGNSFVRNVRVRNDGIQ